MRRIVRPTILVLFFLSGACGLAYEVAWMRMLTLVFGATALATSTVLASFFSGLGLGSFLFGRLVDRVRSPLLIYAALEAGVAACALAMPTAFEGLSVVYVGVARHLGLGWVALTAVRFTLSFLVLLIPATLMGGTLPVVVRFFSTRPDRLGQDVARLYAVNTFGAVAGATATGFFLILLVGTRETTFLAAGLNALIALVALGVWCFSPVEPRSGEPSPVEPLSVEPSPGLAGRLELSPALVRLALGAVAISGLCALALEVLWTRALVFHLDNSTHAFTTMLAAFLLGVAIGSAVIGRWSDRGRRSLARLGWIEVFIGLSAAAAIPMLEHSTPVLQRMATASYDNLLWYKWSGMRFLVSLSVMIVPTALMGTTVPLVVRMIARDAGRVGTSVGHVYAVNTVGGTIGSVLAGFVVIPWLGIQNGILLVGGTNVLLGAVLLLADPELALGRRSRVAAGAAVLLILAAAGWLARGGMILSSFVERMDSAEVLSYDEGVGATVKVFRDADGAKYISIDGFPVAGTSLGMQDAQQALGNLPLLLSRVPGARVNLIGFGAGGASWSSLQFDVERVTCVELVPGVIRAASWFPEVNHDVLDQPRYRVVQGDGRNYAMISDETYDVIAVDATTPKMAGDGSLYSLDFYRLLEKRLSADGLVVQWLPFHLLSDAEMRMTTRTFMEVFPHTTLWLSPIRHHALLVGTRQELRIDVSALSGKLARPGVRENLAPLHVREPMDVLGGFVMGERKLAEWAAGARINSDNHPYLEFAPAFAYFVARKYLIENVITFLRYRESPLPLLTGMGEDEPEVASLREQLARRMESSKHNITGDIYFYLRKTDLAKREYDLARVIDPDDENWASPVWDDLPVR